MYILHISNLIILLEYYTSVIRLKAVEVYLLRGFMKQYSLYNVGYLSSVLVANTKINNPEQSYILTGMNEPNDVEFWIALDQFWPVGKIQGG